MMSMQNSRQMKEGENEPRYISVERELLQVNSFLLPPKATCDTSNK